MNVRPLHDQVIIRPKFETMSKGGIIIPEVARRKPWTGEILAIGPGRKLKDGSVLPVALKVGDRVVYMKYGGKEVPLNGEKVRIVHEHEVLALVENE